MICESCRIGRYQLVLRSYLYPLGAQMVIVPNAPTYMCDVCKESHFDSYFLDTVDLLLAKLVPLPAEETAVFSTHAQTQTPNPPAHIDLSLI